jgi:hypothetical protein
MQAHAPLRRFPWFEVILIVVVISVHAYAAFSPAHNFPNGWFTRDDAYYYFKVAENITEGHGITFDGINPTNGYHPLWLLVCIPIFALARFDLILPLRILLLVMAGLSVATGVLLYRLIARVFSRPIGVLAACLWVFSTYVHATVTQFGLETGLAIFSLVLFLYLMGNFEKKWRSQPITLSRIAELALAALLVLFSRLDLVFLVTIFGFWLIFRKTALRYFLPLDVLAIVAAGLSSFAIRLGFPMYFQYANGALFMTLLSLIVRVPVYYIAGLYQRPGSWSPLKLLLRLVLSASAGTAILTPIVLALFRLNLLKAFPRSALLIDWGLNLFLLFAIRFGAEWLGKHGADRIPVNPVEQFKKNWKQWLREGATYYTVWGLPLGAYMLWNKLAFGTWQPVSGEIKRWWGSLPGHVYGGSARSLAAFFGLQPASDFNAWAPLTSWLNSWNQNSPTWLANFDVDTRYVAMLFLLALLCLAILFISRRRTMRAGFQLSLVPLFASTWLQILSYNSTGYASLKEWYWVSQLVFLILAFSLLIDLLLKPVRRFFITKWLIWGVVILAGTSLAWNFSRQTIRLMPYQNAQVDEPYMDILPLLEENTESGSLIGMTGGGNVSYFIQDRTIVNMDGLINSNAYFRALKAGRAGDYLQAMGLDYIFANPDLLEQIPYRGQFTGRYQAIDASSYGKKDILRFGVVDSLDKPQTVPAP